MGRSALDACSDRRQAGWHRRSAGLEPGALNNADDLLGSHAPSATNLRSWTAMRRICHKMASGATLGARQPPSRTSRRHPVRAEARRPRKGPEILIQDILCIMNHLPKVTIPPTGRATFAGCSGRDSASRNDEADQTTCTSAPAFEASDCRINGQWVIPASFIRSSRITS